MCKIARANVDCDVMYYSNGPYCCLIFCQLMYGFGIPGLNSVVLAEPRYTREEALDLFAPILR